MWKRDQQQEATSGVRQQTVSVPNLAPPSASGVAASSQVETRATTVVAQAVPNPGGSLQIKGAVSASEDLVLYGRLEGTVSLPGCQLTIAPQAELLAEIAARALIIHGSVTGNVAATDRFEIRPGGRMQGDVTCPSVVMSEGSEFTGRGDMRRSFSKTDGSPVSSERRHDSSKS